LLRGLMIFGLGMAITFATALFLKSGFIVFGILHSIGFSLVIAVQFLRFPVKKLLAFGLAAVLAGIFLSGLVFDFPWLLWLGFIPRGFYTIDYFPLLPWLGVLLLGLAFGKKFYAEGERTFKTRVPLAFFKPLLFLGRHSLVVYLLHQPLLIAFLYVTGLNPLGF